MAAYLREARICIGRVVDAIHLRYPQASLRFAFVGYRDVTDPRRFEEHGFTKDVESLKTWMQSLEAKNYTRNVDACEDVPGGLDRAYRLDWMSPVRVAILIADAPCHGMAFHDARSAIGTMK